MFKSSKGFTLVELMVTVVIIGILAAISIPIYNGYVQQADAAEGKALVSSVATALKMFYADNGTYIGFDPTVVNAAQNAHFTSFTTPTLTATTFSVSTTAVFNGTTITITYTQPANASPTETMTVNGVTTPVNL